MTSGCDREFNSESAMTSPDRSAFDVCDPLPMGTTTVLEASAGTGKTYTIAALATRFIAEGTVELSELLLITFGRSASEELRLRVRERLVSSEQSLAAALAAPGQPIGDDRFTSWLCSGDPAELSDRRRRLMTALADFDAATIATIHEFCGQMLDDLGLLGDPVPDQILVERLTELTSEVARDNYLRRYADDPNPPFDFDQAVGLANAVIDSGPIRLAPELGAGALADARLAFATEIRSQVRSRQNATHLVTYDDALNRLRDALIDDCSGDLAAAQLRRRFPVVLVDEFQDTDAVQWDILRRAFHRHSTLIVIGDPKQAIYAFRGADVNSYLDAVRQADTIATLSTNFRSDSELAQALDHIIGGASLGDSAIVVRPVASHHQGRRLQGAGAPVRIRVLPRAADSRPLLVEHMRTRVAADLARDIAALLGSAAELSDTGGPRPVRASDIAVLVRRNVFGEQVRDALSAVGVPVILHGSNSVFSSVAAHDWLRLLIALEQPRSGNIRDAALTNLVGWTFPHLVRADESEIADLEYMFRRWVRLLSGPGVAALQEAIGADTELDQRALSRPDGERLLTDLRHVGQQLHAAATTQQLGPAGLRAWLAAAIDKAQQADSSEELRRLATDAAAVQIYTLHRSKGLQFPIVYLPEASDRFVSDKDTGEVIRLHDDLGPILDIGGRTAAGRADRIRRAQAEDAGEDLRLYYVGLTRAQSQLITWWADTRNTATSALHRFWARPSRSGIPDPRYPINSGPADFATPRASGAGTALIAVEPVGDTDSPARPTVPISSRADDAGLTTKLRARRFTREIDSGWRRTSYSALTAAAHGLSGSIGGSEAEPLKEDDELAEPSANPSPAISTAATELRTIDSPMAALPSGTSFGTLIHTIFERLDPAPALAIGELPAALRATVAEVMTGLPGDGLTTTQLTDALLPCLQTPLGPLADNRTLASFRAGDRLPELDFELPLAGGNLPKGELRLGDLATVLAQHLAADDLLADYPRRITDSALADEPLRGFLTGSIDAVLRVGPTGHQRYLVVDYKTNWLGSGGPGELSLADYAPEQMATAMMAAHYPLQALLYQVALHRMLRWRLPGYHPEDQLGGALYLFLRGMSGPQTPVLAGTPTGVFGWKPATSLILELSDLLGNAGPGHRLARIPPTRIGSGR